MQIMYLSAENPRRMLLFKSMIFLISNYLVRPIISGGCLETHLTLCVPPPFDFSVLPVQHRHVPERPLHVNLHRVRMEKKILDSKHEVKTFDL